MRKNRVYFILTTHLVLFHLVFEQKRKVSKPIETFKVELPGVELLLKVLSETFLIIFEGVELDSKYLFNDRRLGFVRRCYSSFESILQILYYCFKNWSSKPTIKNGA